MLVWKMDKKTKQIELHDGYGKDFIQGEQFISNNDTYLFCTVMKKSSRKLNSSICFFFKFIHNWVTTMDFNIKTSMSIY